LPVDGPLEGRRPRRRVGLARRPDQPRNEPPQLASYCRMHATNDDVPPMPDRDEPQADAAPAAKDALRRAVELAQSAFKDWINAASRVNDIGWLRAVELAQSAFKDWINAASRVNDIGWLLANAIGGSHAEIARLLQARDEAQAEADRLRTAYEAARREVDTLAREQAPDTA